MASYRVEFLLWAVTNPTLREVVVEGENRGKAITEACRQTGWHRDCVISAKSLNPMSGGGSKRG